MRAPLYSCFQDMFRLPLQLVRVQQREGPRSHPSSPPLPERVPSAMRRRECLLRAKSRILPECFCYGKFDFPR